MSASILPHLDSSPLHPCNLCLSPNPLHISVTLSLHVKLMYLVTDFFLTSVPHSNFRQDYAILFRMISLAMTTNKMKFKNKAWLEQKHNLLDHLTKTVKRSLFRAQLERSSNKVISIQFSAPSFGSIPLCNGFIFKLHSCSPQSSNSKFRKQSELFPRSPCNGHH